MLMTLTAKGNGENQTSIHNAHRYALRYPEREGVMAAQNSIHVSDELLAELQAKAAAEGKTVDELAEEALRKSLEDRKWQELLAYGLERGRASGCTVEDVASVVRENRRRNREQRVG